MKKNEWQNLMKQLVDDASPYGAAGKHYIHDAIENAHVRLQKTEVRGMGINLTNDWRVLWEKEC